MSQQQEELSRSSASKSRKATVYTHEYKQQKVCAYYQSGMGIAAFCKKEAIPRTTFQHWVEAFKKAQPTIVSTAMTKDEKTRALEEENARLRRELVKARKAIDEAKADAHAWETMVDVAEEMFGITIRKKAGTKQ